MNEASIIKAYLLKLELQKKIVFYQLFLRCLKPGVKISHSGQPKCFSTFF